MKECIEEGTLQGYFDGELSIEMMEGVAAHLASCLVCKQAARELESESLLLSEALEPEFALSVPSERLRHRVDAAIAGLQVVKPNVTRTVPAVGGWWQSVVELFTLSPQRALGYAGLAAVVLFAAIFGLVQLKRTPANKPTDLAGGRPIVAPVSTPGAVNPPDALAKESPLPQPVSSPSGFAPVAYRPKRNSPPRVVDKAESPHVKLLPGERSYLKTIAALDTTIKSETNRPMRPALQSEYQRNLAMVDSAIAATRRAAKSNPNDPDAAEFMFAAYQTKVDFLNQVADARLPSRQR